MKKYILIGTLIFVFFLSACASLSTYESRLEDNGYNVQTATSEDLPNIIDSETVSDETSISGILYATKGSITEGFVFGFIIEFGSRSEAQEAYEGMNTEGSDFDNLVRHRGNFIFIGSSDDFFDALNLN